ncbi:MAG TPA: hypothetical protein ENK18_05355 [Deltaproteobacteria bacterium]|nr:hypothetical protein [Deltaproteobacteria bacterium]
MVILGLSDGPDAGAALVIDDRIVAASQQARLDRIPRSHAFPWAAIDDVLSRGGLEPGEVDLIAVGGQLTPPFFARRHPSVRDLTRDPFSPAVDAGVFWQALLRRSGLGALEADRTSEWLDQRFRQRGLCPGRVVLVDLHRALAAAAYRCQPDPEALVITLHPRGDGFALAVHRGRAGQLDRRFAQRGVSSLHVHLPRCAAAMGLDPWLDGQRMWGLAARGRPDEVLVGALYDELHAEGTGLSRRALPALERPTDAPWRELRTAPIEVAAASVLQNLRAAVLEVLRAHVAGHDATTLALGGEILDNPRLIADAAGLPGVHRVETAPLPGGAAVALGAALSQAGLAPARLEPRALGASPSEELCERALAEHGGGVPFDPVHAAQVLARGEGVARLAGGHGWSRSGGGCRSVLVRADAPESIERIRRRLELPEGIEPGLACDEGFLRIEHADALSGPLRYGAAAPRVIEGGEGIGGALTADGHVHLQWIDGDQDPQLSKILGALGELVGTPAVALWPLSMGREPPRSQPRGATELWRRAGLGGLQLGSRWVEGSP